MPNLFNRIILQGVEGSSDRMAASKVRLINMLVIFTILILMTLTATNTFFGMYQGSVINVSSIIFLIFVLHLNRRKRHKIASVLFVNFCCLAVFLASYLAYQEDRFTNTEGALYTFLGLSIFLFDKEWKLVQFGWIYMLLISLETIKWIQQYGSINTEYYLLIINVSVVVVGLFFFLNIFKKTLLKSLKDTNENQSMLFSLIDNVPIFMALEGRNRRYKMVNKKYVEEFNMSREEIIGARSKDVLPDYIWQNHTKFLDRAFSGEFVEFSEQAKLPNGTRMFASGKFVPIKNIKGDIEYVTVYVDDVTKLKLVEEQLKSELKDKDKLFSIIAHDIRSPLNLFEGLLNASDNQVITQEEFLVFKDKLRERFISLQETINGLLEWSRLQLDRIQPAPVTFAPEKIVGELINVFKPIAESKEITINQIGKAEEATMDINHFRIIFRNLLHNALKFTPNGGEINVKYGVTEECVEVSVSDSGVGMSEEAIEKVMTKAEVASATGTMGETGTGLGLHLSLELLEKNGGQMSIHRNEVAGTTFQVLIPRQSK